MTQSTSPKAKRSPAKRAPIKNVSAGEAAGPQIIQPGNIELRWDETARRLIVSIDCGSSPCRAAVASKSGKSRILASTSGFWSIPVAERELAGLQLSLTATLPAAK